MHSIPVPILILQHPQEPSRKDGEISSAQILKNELSPCHVSVGLSKRNLEQAVKGWKEIEGVADLQKPQMWYTLYLGTKKQGSATNPTPGIYYLDKKGEPKAPPENPTLGGLIILDGTWSQAKTLWWRNPWLLKTHRIYIVPKSKSLYGNLRKEPRPECVSTLEAVAETLTFLGVDEAVEAHLKAIFGEKLKGYRRK